MMGRESDKKCFMSRDHRHAMIELHKDELVHDVKNTAYIVANSLEGQGVDNARLHNLYDVGEDGNREKLARMLDSAVEDCKERLFHYTRRLGRCAFASDEWEEVTGSPENDDEAYYLCLNTADNVSATSIRTMAVYAHDYVVYNVLKEWAVLVYPDVAERMAALAAKSDEKLKEASLKVVLTPKIRLSTF